MSFSERNAALQPRFWCSVRSDRFPDRKPRRRPASDTPHALFIPPTGCRSCRRQISLSSVLFFAQISSCVQNNGPPFLLVWFSFCLKTTPSAASAEESWKRWNMTKLLTLQFGDHRKKLCWDMRPSWFLGHCSCPRFEIRGSCVWV